MVQASTQDPHTASNLEVCEGRFYAEQIFVIVRVTAGHGTPGRGAIACPDLGLPQLCAHICTTGRHPRCLKHIARKECLPAMHATNIPFLAVCIFSTRPDINVAWKPRVPGPAVLEITALCALRHRWLSLPSWGLALLSV